MRQVVLEHWVKPYLPLQWPLDKFRVFLCGAVPVTQFAIITVTPAEHLTLRSEGQRVAIGALG